MGVAGELQGNNVGERLRRTRVALRMTLKQVADKAALSESYVSQLERGKVNGSIAALQRIAAALSTTLSELFDSNNDVSPVRVLRKEARPSLIYGILGRKYLLTPTPLENLLVFIGRFEPGGSTGDELYAHADSDELFLVMSGTFELEVGSDRFALAEGDCVNYRSSIPHRAVNTGPEVGEVMWIVSPPSL